MILWFSLTQTNFLSNLWNESQKLDFGKFVQELNASLNVYIMYLQKILD